MDGQLRFMGKTDSEREIELEAVVNAVDGKVRAVLERESMSSLATWGTTSLLPSLTRHHHIT